MCMILSVSMARRSARLAGKVGINYCTEHASCCDVAYGVAKASSCVRNQKSSKKRKTSQYPNHTQSVAAEINSKKLDTKIESVTIKTETNYAEACQKNSMFIGCHTSISGGLWKAPEEAAAIGAKAFGLFLHSQQQWKMKPLAEGHAQRFRDTCEKLNFQPGQIVPHGSYLMNCGSPKADVKEKSDEMLILELQRCEELGLLYFNFHPGSTLGKISVDECLQMIADAINKAHRATKYVIVLLENMSCQGNTVGGKFQELQKIIEKVDDKSRIGVCVDTCHSHAAGYDLSTSAGYQVFTQDLESIIGWKYIKAFHLNDSKGPSGCHKDRHENIGKGTIGLNGFRRLMNDSRFSGIPMILETPYKNDDIYKKEIQLLYSLIE